MMLIRFWSGYLQTLSVTSTNPRTPPTLYRKAVAHAFVIHRNHKNYPGSARIVGCILYSFGPVVNRLLEGEQCSC